MRLFFEGSSPAAPADPFGLWQLAAPQADGSQAAFGASGESTPGEVMEASAADEEVMVWTLPLTSGPGGSAAGEKDLDQRAEQVRAIAAGLDLAAARLETFVSAPGHSQHVERLESAASTETAASTEAGAVFFSMDPASRSADLPAPEAHLAIALRALSRAGAGEAVPYGVGEDVSWLAGHASGHLPGGQQTGVDWDALCQRLGGLVESVNRQLLHFAWVDTTLDGRLAARTVVSWTGDMTTLWQPGPGAEQTAAAHCRSLALAMASRSANLRTIFTVAQIAARIALAAGNPLLAMPLAWQFVREVVMPMMEENDG